MHLTNAGEIIARVHHELRGVPNISVERTAMWQLLNEVHSQLCSQYDWPFLQEVRNFWQFPDILFETGVEVYADPPPKSSSSERVLVIDDVVSMMETLGFAPQDMYALGELLERFVGATVEMEPDFRALALPETAVGTWGMGAFEVQRVFVTSNDPELAVGAEPAAVGLWLIADDRLNSTSGAMPSILFRFPRLLLDADVASVRWVRRRGHDRTLKPITATAGHRLEEHREGDPEVWWMDEGLRPERGPAGMYATALPPLSAMRRAGAVLGRQVPTPYNGMGSPTPTLPAGFTATADVAVIPDEEKLQAGKYRVRLAWMVAGRLSPPTEPVEVTISGSNNIITVANIPERGLYWHGWTMTIWVSKDGGPYYLAQGGAIGDQQNAHPHYSRTLDEINISRAFFDWANPSAMVRWDEVYAGPEHRYITLWPRPTLAQQYEMGIVRRPRQLVENTDAPHLPQEFNDLLVWEMVARIAPIRHGDTNTGVVAAGLAAKRLDALKERFGMHKARNVQRALYGETRQNTATFIDVDYQAED